MFTLIKNLNELHQILSNTKLLAVDLETTSLSPLNGTIRLIQIADDKDRIYITDCFNFNLKDISTTLKPYLENKQLKLVIQNSVFERKWFKHVLDIELGTVFDTMFASKLLGFEDKAGLGFILKNYLNVDIDKTEQKSDWGGTLSQSQLEYAALDVKYLLRLREVMYAKLKDLNMLEAAKNEFETVPAVASMELAGFPINVNKMYDFINITEKERDVAYKDLNHFLLSAGGKKSYERTYSFDLFGGEVETKNESTVNIRSTKQLIESFKEAGIDISTTDKKIIAIEAQKKPELKLLLKFREKEKLCSTYGRDFLRKYVQPDGRVYGSFIQMGAITSRFAARNPNTMNYPRSKAFRGLFEAPQGRKFVQCLAGDTLISTSNGLIRIKDLDCAQDKVLQEDGSYENVARVINNGSRQVYELKTECGFSVKATEEHKFQVLNDFGNIAWKEVRNLTQTDYLILKAGHEFEGYDVRFPKIILNHHNNAEINVPSMLDVGFAELLGLIVGNGSFENDEGVFGLCINWKDKDLIQYTKNLLLEYFKVPHLREYSYRGIHEFKFTSKPLGSWFKEIGLSKNSLPKFLFTAKKEMVAAFLRGYFETDGSVNKVSNKGGGAVTLSSSRKQIIEELHKVLLRFGIVSSFYQQDNIGPDRRFTCYGVTIAKSFTKIFRDCIGFISLRKQDNLQLCVSCVKTLYGNYGGVPNLFDKVVTHWDKLNKFVPARNIRFAGKHRQLTKTSAPLFNSLFPELQDVFHTKYISEKYNCFFLKLTDVKLLGVETVFDITVPQSGKFIANGLVTHNCDFSQYELRALADYSQDAIMLDAFATGKDLHSVTMSMLFGIPYDECKLPENSEKRTFSKIVNFSIAYGIGAQGLALRLQAEGIDTNEIQCQELIDNWYSSYEGAGRWLKKQRYLVNNAIKKNGWKAGEQGFVDLVARDGRIIRTKFIVGDFSSEAGSKRDCMNFLLQCTNSLSTKKALTLMYYELSAKYPSAKLVNVIHDEVLVECDGADAEAVKEIVERCMIEGGKAFLYTVNVVADAKICQNWAEK